MIEKTERDGWREASEMLERRDGDVEEAEA